MKSTSDSKIDGRRLAMRIIFLSATVWNLRPIASKITRNLEQ